MMLMVCVGVISLLHLFWLMDISLSGFYFYDNIVRVNIILLESNNGTFSTTF